MIAGVAIDNLKLEVFSRHLTQSGYKFETAELPHDCLLLSVETDNVEALGSVVYAAEAECQGLGERQ